MDEMLRNENAVEETVNEIANEAANEVVEAVDTAEEIADTAEDVAGTVDEAVSEVAEAADTIEETVNETAEEVAEIAEDTEDIAEGEEGENTEEGEEPAEDLLAGAFQNYVPEKKPMRWPIVLLAVLLGIVFVGGLLWAFGVFKPAEKEPEAPPQGDVTADVMALPAAKSADFTVTNGMFAYFMESTYQSYSGYMASYGLDATKPLKEQEAMYGTGTWFDYFADYTKSQAEWMLLWAEEAKAAGITPDESLTAQMDSMVSSFDASAFKNPITQEDVQAFFTLYASAVAAEEARMAEYTFTDEQVQAAFAENPNAYQSCDYVAFPIGIGEGRDFATAEDAADLRAALEGAADAEAFRKIVVDFLAASEDYDESAAASAYEGGCIFTAQAFNEGDGISDWLFADTTKPGDTKAVESDGMIAVYMLTASPYRDTSRLTDVRHILFTPDTYGSDEAAEAKAREILAQWQNGDATADSFAALAKEYSEDPGSAVNGGLITDITPGQMVQEFNDWCFDESRQTGDFEMVQTSYGFHLMYFEAAREAWESQVRSNLLNEQYDLIYAHMQDTYPITMNDDNIQQLDL